MSRLSDFLRRRRIDPAHHTRRALARYVDKRGFVVGDFSYGAPEIMPWGHGRLTVGAYCSIGQRTRIFLGHGDHRPDCVSIYPFAQVGGFSEARGIGEPPPARSDDVAIGSDVWIGAGVTILAGISIGHGAVIGTESVVSRDVSPYAIVVGNPARLVRHRFDDAAIDSLLAIAWWDLPRPDVVALMPYLVGSDIDGFIAAATAVRDRQVSHGHEG